MLSLKVLTQGQETFAALIVITYDPAPKSPFPPSGDLFTNPALFFFVEGSFSLK